MAQVSSQKISALVPALLAFPYHHVWSHYDKDADVLYLNFQEPNAADDSEITDDDVIIRYSGEEIVGMTILRASKRAAQTK
ncbi:MAG: DUF2283 domain-containing protein [Bryobacter sp.]|jgi:uncharacterized protein YuzE|nr:DUF2283 domain-containing protein [Bryobacter sp.]